MAQIMEEKTSRLTLLEKKEVTRLRNLKVKNLDTFFSILYTFFALVLR